MNASRRTWLCAVGIASLLGACEGSSSEGGHEPGGPGGPGGPGPVPNVPSDAADIDSTYAKLGKGCGQSGYVMRSLTFAPSRNSVLWGTPLDDAASLSAAKNARGWGALVLPGQLGVEEVREEVTTESPDQAARCGAAREIFSPFTENNRMHDLHVLVFAGDHPHPEGWPAEGLPAPVRAPVRLRAYLDAASAVRESTSNGVLYSSVEHQYIPIYLRCDNELTIAYEGQRVPGTWVRAHGLDPQLCRPIAGEDDAYTCLYERIQPLEGACSFVAVGAVYRTNAGNQQRLSFGGRIEPGKRYHRITVDRFSFH
ncbi:hypothetical protein [Pendulispora albinea]|uniref:Uncharacterized protein n=1 Tax=Pendulispora albinea TaxID=2741071 RepID=A0ABZ2MC02_9BACT